MASSFNTYAALAMYQKHGCFKWRLMKLSQRQDFGTTERLQLLYLRSNKEYVSKSVIVSIAE